MEMEIWTETHQGGVDGEGRSASGTTLAGDSSFFFFFFKEGLPHSKGASLVDRLEWLPISLPL